MHLPLRINLQRGRSSGKQRKVFFHLGNREVAVLEAVEALDPAEVVLVEEKEGSRETPVLGQNPGEAIFSCPDADTLNIFKVEVVQGESLLP